MILIYHNPNSKISKRTLEILETSKHNQQALKYNEKPLDEIKLKKIIRILGIKPIDLIRKDCKLWKDYYMNHLKNESESYTDSDLIQLMTENHELIERPIIINNKTAIIGKPPKRVFNIV